MGKRLPVLNDNLTAFINAQPLFFVATAAPEGRVNLSPKGMDSLRVVAPDTIIWVNLTGSGNETSAHLLQDPRMTLMWCAFEGKPLILRAYGKAISHSMGSAFWDEHIQRFPGYAGSRQLLEMKIGLVQQSCGMGVPLMQFQQERDLLEPWAKSLGEEGMHAYRQTKNTSSLDGFPTDILPEK